MPGPTLHYPQEFKREAVELYRSSEKSIPKIAKELGIADESLSRWVRQHDINFSGERALTQGWARSIHSAYPHLQGICYSSSMNGGQRAVVLTERAEAALPARPLSNRALSDPTLTAPLRVVCSKSTSIGYELLPACVRRPYDGLRTRRRAPQETSHSR